MLFYPASILLKGFATSLKILSAYRMVFQVRDSTRIYGEPDVFPFLNNLF